MNALADPEVGRYLNEHFVSSFQKVATFRIVNGQKQGGNVASYFCAPDGRVLHAIAGPVDAPTMLREARWVVENARKAIEKSKRDNVSFKKVLRSLHAERLAAEHGLTVEPVTYDPPAPSDDGPLTARDPTGRPLAAVLPEPPVDGPDVSLGGSAPKAEMARLQVAEKDAAGAREIVARGGRSAVLGNQGRVHLLLSSYSMLEIEKLYATVFQDILGERVTTDPVITIDARGPRHDVCLHCESKRALSSLAPERN